jgi:uncharacterized membrane protein
VLTGILALLPVIPRWAIWLILISFLVVGLERFYLNQLNYSPIFSIHSDNEMIAKYALEALKRGQNPYEWNFSDIVRVYRDRSDYVTPFLDGSSQNRLTYPALPVLILWMFDKLGLGQVAIVNIVFYLLLLYLVFLGTPVSLRPVILLPLAILSAFTGIALNGAQDVVWSALLVGMILAWKRPVWRAVLFGLAAAFHQQPWFIAPFLVIVLWYTPGTLAQRARSIGLFGMLSAGVFLLLNLPFILWNFREWWSGVFEPGYAAFNMYSQGLGSLSVYGLSPLPREFYSSLQLAFLAAALLIQARHPRWVGGAFWIFPAIFFWLYYRGLANYWIFWLPPLLVSIARNQPLPKVNLSTNRSHRPMLTAGIVALMLIILTGLGVYYTVSRPTITAYLNLPITSSDDGQLSNQLQISISNNSASVFRPRFAVQRDPGLQALPWTILSGPESLAPGDTQDYTISPRESFSSAFSLDQGAQVVVSDADGSYWRRAVVSIPVDSSAASADLIHNPGYLYWTYDGALPARWALDTPSSTTVKASLKSINDRESLTLTIQNTSEAPGFLLTKLTQRVTFPGSISLWVYPTIEMKPSNEDYYGLETDDSVHKLWILFGSATRQAIAGAPNRATVFIPAALNVWSQQTVDLGQLYADFKWSLPPFSIRAGNEVDYPARQINLSLIAGSSQRLESNWNFGAVGQDDSVMSIQRLVADAVTHPDLYYVYVGDEYFRQRNYDQAEQAYRTALISNDRNDLAYWGLARCRFADDDRQGAIIALDRALTFWFAHY